MAPETKNEESVGTGPFRYQWPTQGRRAERNAAEARRQVLVRDTHDTSRLVKMAPRAVRRAKQGDNFRPVYHHGIPTKLPHKAIIAAMGIHKSGRRAAASWQSQVNTARACVSFGLAVKLFLANLAKEAKELRHATLKAEGKWITHKARK